MLVDLHRTILVDQLWRRQAITINLCYASIYKRPWRTLIFLRLQSAQPSFDLGWARRADINIRGAVAFGSTTAHNIVVRHERNEVERSPCRYPAATADARAPPTPQNCMGCGSVHLQASKTIMTSCGSIAQCCTTARAHTQEAPSVFED